MTAMDNQQMLIDLKVVDKLASIIAKSTSYSTERIREQIVEYQMIETCANILVVKDIADRKLVIQCSIRDETFRYDILD